MFCRFYLHVARCIYSLINKEQNVSSFLICFSIYLFFWIATSGTFFSWLITTITICFFLSFLRLLFYCVVFLVTLLYMSLFFVPHARLFFFCFIFIECSFSLCIVYFLVFRILSFEIFHTVGFCFPDVRCHFCSIVFVFYVLFAWVWLYTYV